MNERLTRKDREQVERIAAREHVDLAAAVFAVGTLLDIDMTSNVWPVDIDEDIDQVARYLGELAEHLEELVSSEAWRRIESRWVEALAEAELLYRDGRYAQLT